MRFLVNLIFKCPNGRVFNSSRRFYSMSQTQVDSSSSVPPKLSEFKLDDPKKTKKKSKVLTEKPRSEDVDKSTDPSSELRESEDKSVVLRKPIPKNFIKETLLPHLEHNVAYNCMKFPPDVVLQIGIAYSRLPHFIRQRSIEDALIESFRYRMVDYTVSDCIQLLNTCFQLQGLRSVSVYFDIVSRLEVPHVYNSINSLNRLGICRSVSKIISHSHQLCSPNGSSEVANFAESAPDLEGKAKGEDLALGNKFLSTNWNIYHDTYKTSPMRPWSYLVKSYKDKRISGLVDRLVSFCENRILPQLEYELQSFDPDELTDLLSVLAQRREGEGLDFPVVSILMANIVRQYPQTSLANSLNNLWSLCRMKIRHDGFLDLVLADLRNPLKVANIYQKHLSTSVWCLARFGLLEEVLPELMPHVARNVPKFGASCFARLCQVCRFHPFSKGSLQEDLRNVVLRVCLCLFSRLDSFSPKDLTFFLSGLFQLGLVPSETSFLLEESLPVKPKFEKQDRYLTRAQKSSDANVMVRRFLECLETLNSEFDLWEIERLVQMTRSFQDYEYLLQHFPGSWANIINPSETPS